MFIPRMPVIQNQFCSYGAQTGTGSAGIGGVIAYAGSVVYLDPTASNQESIVFKMAHDVSETPFGFSMQKVKTGYHQVHPNGFVMPGDLGSSDAIAQSQYDATGNITGTKAVPVGVAHMGIWDTVHYTCSGGTTAPTALVPGTTMTSSADEGKLTNSAVDSIGTAATDKAAGARVNTAAGQVSVARVMKGASVAKVTANVNNTTLYPIRVKLLV
jgi:hypothetical protein